MTQDKNDFRRAEDGVKVINKDKQQYLSSKIGNASDAASPNWPRPGSIHGYVLLDTPYCRLINPSRRPEM
ncbi:MAG: hypothetical protein KGZ73_08115 [Rhizobiales bacterium]|nr:hypothetical protein [Hyphomicrobiales bacterium]